MGTSGPASDITLEDTLEAFEDAPGPRTPLTASEVAEALGCKRHAARGKLTQLVERDRLDTKAVGSDGRVWWRPRDDEASGGVEDGSAEPAQFRDFVRAVEDYAIFMLDPEGHVVSWNQGAERIKGYTEEQVVGEHFSIFYTDEGVERGVPSRNLEAAREHGHTTDEGWRVRADGTEFWADVVITAIYDNGVLQGFTKVTRDLTERKRAEDALAQEREFLDRLLETSPVGIATISRDGNVTRANSRALDVFGLSKGEGGGYVPDERSIYDQNGDPVPPDERPHVRVFESGERVSDWECQIEDSDGDRRWVSIDAAPLSDDAGETEQVVLAVEDVTVSKRQARQLRRERDFVERILEAVPMSILVFNRDGEIERMNARARDRLDFGESEDPAVGTRAIYDENGDPVPLEQRPYVEAFETGEPTFGWEGQVDLPKGRVWMSLNVVPLGDEDSPERVLVTGNNVTKRKERTRRLQRRYEELEAELDEVYDRVDDAFYALDSEWRFTYLNERAEELVRQPREAVVGESIWEEFPRAAEGRIWEKYHDAMESQETVSFRHYFETLDRWTEFNVYPSETGLSVYFRDITDRVERERELEQYEHIVEAVEDGVYTVDVDGRFTFVNPAYAELTGHSREELLGEPVTTVVDSETAETARSLERDLLAGEGETTTFEADLRTADGETIRAEATFALLPREGEDQRIGVVCDVTERKRYERRLRTLNDTSRELMHAESDQEVTEVVSEAASEILDIPGVSVYHYDADANELYPAEVSTEEGFMRRKLPRVSPDDGSLTGHVFDRGEPRRFENILDSPHTQVTADQTEMRAGVFAPMGDHGLLIGGAREVGAFDESTQRLFELLAADAEAAYDRVERERELRRHERIVDTVGDGVYVLDRENRFQLVNDALVSMTQFDRTELLGTHGSEVFGEQFDTLDRRAREQLSETEDVAVFEEEIRTARDESITVESRFRRFPVEGGWGRVGVVRDITERKNYERELKRYETLIEESTDVNAILDTDGTLEYLTPSVEHVLGYEPDELVGENGFEYIHPDDREEAIAEFTRLVEDPDYRATTEYRFRHQDGSWTWLAAHARNLLDDPDIGGIVAYTRDVTDRVRYEDRLRETVAELEESNERLEQFAYVVSHDLQEPLRMVTNYLQLVENRYAEKLDEDGREFIDFAVDGAKRMREMINDLLAYSRVDTQAEPLEPTDCDAAVESVLRNLELRIEETDADVTVDPLPTVVADRNQLEQVFQNLVSNALKYHSGGSPRVEVGVERRDGAWEFSVADDGIGIDPDHQDRIFDVFGRLHSQDEYEGTGVGLALCRKVVERHGGRLWVESEPGDGSTFYFTVPTREEST